MEQIRRFFCLAKKAKSYILLDMVTGDTFFLYLKSMPEYADIPIIILSNSSSRDYNLTRIDPNLAFLSKKVTKEWLVKEIKAKIRIKINSFWK